MLKCQYCGKDAVLVTGDKIYPHLLQLHNRKFWLCAQCKAYVGCYNKGVNITNVGKSDGTYPLGSLANAELRKWRTKVHSILNPILKTKDMRRKDIYKMLAKYLNIRISHCHIALLNIEQCQNAIEFLNKKFPPK